MRTRRKLKLHLGCGQVCLRGYLNIDYPLTEHTVQQDSVADEFADLTDMQYPAETVDEIRLHHVFEHFPRPQATALIASWHTWLKQEGRLHIEVPDFDATAALIISPDTSEHEKCVAIRHIFGSNEAGWAVHYDGWNEGRLRELLGVFGFTIETVGRNAYLATRNIEIIATKTVASASAEHATELARTYLSAFAVDSGPSETRLLEIWVEAFRSQIAMTFAP
jgi:predicted SAM-dependent methyltransferase